MSIGRQIAFWVAAFVALGLVLRAPRRRGDAIRARHRAWLSPRSDRAAGWSASASTGWARRSSFSSFSSSFSPSSSSFSRRYSAASSSPSRRSCRAMSSRLQALAVDEGNALLEKYGGPWREQLGLDGQLSSEQIQKSVGDLVAQGGAMDPQCAALARLGRRGGLQLPVLPGRSRPSSLSTCCSTGTRCWRPIDSWLPLDHRDGLRQIAGEINHALAGLPARPVAGLPVSRPLVRDRPQPDRAGFRISDRRHRRSAELHPLCRLADRPGLLARRRHRPGLAELESGSPRAWRWWAPASSSKAMCFRRSWWANRSACIRSG